ncbi:MAG: serine/threonine protein kinase [Mariniblastus sp.]|nr:serine/threonine protein kinase [Mariniblastus sp.]
MSNQRDFLGPFQLVRLIRSGTTTQVWEALRHDDRDGDRERLALKVLNREVRKNKVEIEYLRHEASVGKTLDHANVIQVYGFHNIYSLPFLSMQLFNARNLKIELRERPEEIAINLPGIIRKSAEGIQHLHEKGWLHCDIKPDNFLADEQGNVKLIDFSIAEKPGKKGLSALLAFGKSKTIRGTRSYMAPEQIRRKPLDVRADIYAFGCVLFELLAGRTPFSATNPNELLSKHLTAPPPNLLAVSSATRELSTLIGRMMAKSPSDRPQSMADFLFEFSKVGVFRAGKRPTGLVRDPGSQQ